MNPMMLNQMKYEAMERATTEQGRMLAHDAGNAAMYVVMSEYGAVRMLQKMRASKN